MKKTPTLQRFGVYNGNSKLTPHQVAIIRRGLEEGISTYKLSERFNVCQSTIMRIKRGETWIPNETP